MSKCHQLEQLLTRKEVSQYLRVSLKTLDNFSSDSTADQPKLPRIKIGRKWLYRRSDVDRWISSQIARDESSCVLSGIFTCNAGVIQECGNGLIVLISEGYSPIVHAIELMIPDAIVVEAHRETRIFVPRERLDEVVRLLKAHCPEAERLQNETID